MRRSPAVVDRKAIAEHAWQDETDPLGSNAIDVQISRLRAKLPECRRPDRHGPRRGLPAGGDVTAGAAAGRPVASRSGSPSPRPRSSRSAYLVVCSPSSPSSTQNLTRRSTAGSPSASSTSRHGPPSAGAATTTRRRGGPRFGPPLLVWTVARTVGRARTRPTRSCPASTSTSTGPTTVTIGDDAGPDPGRADRRRLRGRRPDASTAVAQAQDQVILAELVIAPILLIVVFLGAVAIGRRVAAPIERARRPPARVHRGRLARAADAALGHRGPDEPRPRAARERRLVSDRVPASRPRVAADAPAPRRPAVARPVRRDPGAARRRAGGRRRPGGPDRRPVRGHRRDPPSLARPAHPAGQPRRHGSARVARPAPRRAARQRLQVLPGGRHRDGERRGASATGSR